MADEQGPNDRFGDAVRFVAVSEGLRDAFAQLDAAQLPARRRTRWQRRLMGITNAARRDLPGAQAQLDRYREDWQREVSPPDPDPPTG